jgi:hypothetical protein
MSKTVLKSDDIRKKQHEEAEAKHAAGLATLTVEQKKAAANLPAVTNGGAVAAPKSTVNRYIDEISPSSIVGALMKFNKDRKFEVTADGTILGDDRAYIAHTDKTHIGRVKFGRDGEPPQREGGLLYQGYVMPPRESLGDTDESKWEVGLSGQREDPWQHQILLVLERVDDGAMFTFATTSKTDRGAVGDLLRSYERMKLSNPDVLPLVKLKSSGFQHKDPRIGWVGKPAFAVCGRVNRDETASGGGDGVDPSAGSIAADLNDEIPI